MTTESKYQLACLDESYVSDLSDENQSEVLGGTFGLLSWLFGGWGYKNPQPQSQPTTTNIYIYNNNTNTNTSGSSSGAVAGTPSGSSGPKYH